MLVLLLVFLFLVRRVFLIPAVFNCFMRNSCEIAMEFCIVDKPPFFLEQGADRVDEVLG